MVWRCLTIILLIAPVYAIQHPPGYGEICFPCHDLLLNKSEQTKLAHCKCHNVEIWRDDHVDMEKLSKLHGISPCIKCHIGSGYNGSLIVHIPHKNVDCKFCHSELAVKPESSNCYYCHKGGIHEVHGNILNEICVSCHGKPIYKFTELRREVGLNVTKVEKPKPFSLYDLIRSILSTLLGLFK